MLNIGGRIKLNNLLKNILKSEIYFRGNWNIVTYDLKHYIEVLLSNIKED